MFHSFMSSFFQGCCHVTESMPFKPDDIQLGTSFTTSQPNTYNRLKCFNCFGLEEGQQFCIHCGGTGFVTDSHPLAMLLNEVMQKKLGKTEIAKEPTWTEYEDVEAIQQEEEELDQRKIMCDICNKQCDVNYKYFCQCCECFYVCIKCAESKSCSIEHQHPLATNKNVPDPLINIKRTSSQRFSQGLKNNDSDTLNRQSPRRNKIEDEQNHLNYFNVCDIIEEQISNKYFHVAQNNVSHSTSTLINDIRISMSDSLHSSQFQMMDSQNLQIYSQTIEFGQQNNFNNRSKFKSHRSRFFEEMNMQNRQSIDFNLVQNQIQVSFGNRESFGFGFDNLVVQICNNCRCQLKNVYSVCRTCQNLNQDYKICCQCDDKKLYKHNKTHKMEMRLGNLLGEPNSEMISKSLIESDDGENDSLKNQPKLRNKKSLYRRPPRLQQVPFDETFSDKKSFSKLLASHEFQNIGMQKNNCQIQMFERQSIVNMNCDELFTSMDLSQVIQPVQLIQKKSSLEQIVNHSLQTLPEEAKSNEGRNDKKVSFAQLGSDDSQKHHNNFMSSESQSQQAFGIEGHHFQKILRKVQKSARKTSKNSKSMILSKKSEKQLSSSKQMKKSGRSSLKQSIKSSLKQTFKSSPKQSVKNNRSSIKFNTQIYQHQYRSSLAVEDSKINQKEEFFYHQYCCDVCGCDPIKNIRYHCLECEDFDVCQDCFGVELTDQHNHNFEKIDGLKKILEKKSMMLHRKDSIKEKGKETLLKSSNINMLFKSKRTVQMMKNSVSQLSSGISSMTRSYGPQASLFSQRFSFKNYVENKIKIY